jgi:hypothetical protein
MSLFNITPLDYESGILLIATNKHTEDTLQAYIDEYDVPYLQDMLGCELYELFLADLVNGVPQSQRFIDIFEPFCKDDDCYGIQKSEGIKIMVKYFIYWEYVKQQRVNNTNTGDVINENEVSRVARPPETKLYSTYNKAIKTYCAIQWFICDNLTVYPEFEGVIKQKTSWL